MTLEEAMEYLRKWADVNAGEVYGSRAEFISIHALKEQLEKIENTSKRSGW